MTAHFRRRVWFAVFVLAFIPGGIATILFRNSIIWVNIQSWLALWISAAAVWAAETPVEQER